MGVIIDEYQATKTIRLSELFGCLSLASIGFVALGILDTLLAYVTQSFSVSMGIVEIVVGIMLSLFLNFIKGRFNSVDSEVEPADEVQ